MEGKGCGGRGVQWLKRPGVVATVKATARPSHSTIKDVGRPMSKQGRRARPGVVAIVKATARPSHSRIKDGGRPMSKQGRRARPGVVAIVKATARPSHSRIKDGGRPMSKQVRRARPGVVATVKATARPSHSTIRILILPASGMRFDSGGRFDHNCLYVIPTEGKQARQPGKPEPGLQGWRQNIYL